MSQLDDLVNGESDFRRDRWGRPLIMQLDGKRLPYTRASSATKAIDDTWNLDQWDRRNVSYGMAHDASLVARVLAIGGDPSSWSKDDKDAVAKVVDDARTVAKAHKGADIGTAVHRIIQRRNLGHDISAGPYQADVDAYYRALEAARIDVLANYLEVRLVDDVLGLAGSADNIFGYAGAHRIGDLKTGATVSYGALGFAGQLAAYAHGKLYDVDQECRMPTPELDQELGFIIHLPAGEGRCDIYEIDLVKGYQAAKVAFQARAAQKAAKSWLVHHTGFAHAKETPCEPSAAALTTTTPPVTSAEPSTSRSDGLTSADPALTITRNPSSSSTTPTLSRADVVARARALVEAHHAVALQYTWPEGVPGFKGEHQHTPAELRAIYQAICTVEDDHGMSPGFVDADRTRETVPTWEEQRRRSAIRKARAAWDDYWEPDVMADILYNVIGYDVDDVNAAFAALTYEDATRIQGMAELLNNGFDLVYNGSHWAVTPPKERVSE